MKAEKLFEHFYGYPPASAQPLTAAGSPRRYYRFSDAAGNTVVGCEGTDAAENEAFIALSDAFSRKNFNVPKVIAVSDDRLSYLQTDLGDTSLFDERHRIELLEKAVRGLVNLQYGLGEAPEWHPYPVESFDERCVLWDLNYFKYSFLNTVGISYSEPKLQTEFEKMAQRLSRPHARTFMYRDFQARNVMVSPDDEVWFIDFQGGRRGPGVYDLVSFVRQARAAYSPEVQQHLKNVYFEAVQSHEQMSREEFETQYREYSLLRSLQTLGAYGLRGRFERKPHFLKSIRPALAALRELVATPFEEYPYLMNVIEKMIDKEFSRLTVTVGSFSYKKGYPEDTSGNGGGFVFDCRALDNPGRYDEYKSLTGRDRPVIEFLEEHQSVATFKSACSRLVDQAVSNYIERGFTSLSVWFGCTGGRHRSVYNADCMARHLREKYPEIRIVLNHREQGISEEL